MNQVFFWSLEEGLAGLEAFISYQQTDFLGNNGTFFTDSNGLQNVQRQFRTAQKLESNFFPVTTSIFIQERRRGRKEQQQRELAILTDRSQAGTSLKEGQVVTERPDKVHSVWKSQKKSHSTLRAKRATLNFELTNSLFKMPKLRKNIKCDTLDEFQTM